MDELEVHIIYLIDSRAHNNLFPVISFDPQKYKGYMIEKVNIGQVMNQYQIVTDADYVYVEKGNSQGKIKKSDLANAMSINQFIKLLNKGDNIEVKAYYAIFNIADATTAGYMFGVFANKVIPLSKSNSYSTTEDNPDTVNIYRKDEWTLVIQNNASNRTIRATIISSIT